jgi:hypothetical protein
MTDPSSESTAQTPLLRHILPIIAGAIVAVALSIVTDNWLSAHQMLPAPGVVPSTGVLLLVLAYRGLFAIVGCHLAARLAPRGQPRIRYALALGALLLALNAIGAGSNWGVLPTWYLLASIALQGPWAIIGGGTATHVMSRATQ